MRVDSRLSRMLHVLIHMAQTDSPVTSEAIGRMLSTNPVVVRRTMSGLRDKGYVHSEKGHSGGWRLVARLEAISLLDVYRALGAPSIFALGPAADQPDCLVERAVNEAVDEAFQAAEALLMKRFAQVTIAEIASSFDQRCQDQGVSPEAWHTLNHRNE